MLKITCSGSFKTNPGTDKDRRDFTNVTGLIPNCTEEYHMTNAMRMFPIWKKDHKELKDIPFSGIIKLYIDDVEEVEGQPLCAGKDIKTMTWEELQSLACYKSLRGIPLYRSGSLRAAQEAAYESYQANVLKKRIFKQPRDVADFKETLRRNMENLMLSEDAIEERINDEMKTAFNMIVDMHNPQKSYSFAKVDSIIVEGYDVPKKPKKASKEVQESE